MRRHVRILSVVIFSALFCLLIGGLLAHADEGIIVEPVDRFYPIQALKDVGIKVQNPRPRSWYETKAGERWKIFEAGQMTEQIKKWDELDKDMFLERLDRKGASETSLQYKQFKMSQMKAAEAKLRKVREE